MHRIQAYLEQQMPPWKYCWLVQIVPHVIVLSSHLRAAAHPYLVSIARRVYKCAREVDSIVFSNVFIVVIWLQYFLFSFVFK